MRDDKLATWLSEQLRMRSWSARELARQAGVSHTIINHILAETKTATADMCIKIAKALGEEPEIVLRIAGKMPRLPPEVEDEREYVAMYRKLEPRLRDMVKASIRGLLGQSVTITPSVRERSIHYGDDPLIQKIVARIERLSLEDLHRLDTVLDKLDREQSGIDRASESSTIT